jgi:hypothetical protein
MPFGLINAGATFQQAMQIDFDDLIGKIIQIYLDDLTVYSKIQEDHFNHLRQVFLHCRKFGMSLNPTKSIFGVTAGKLLDILYLIQASILIWRELFPFKIFKLQLPKKKFNHSWVRSISSEDLYLILLEW